MQKDQNKSKELTKKLQDKKVRQQLGMNDEIYEERKQQKYLYSINREDDEQPVPREQEQWRRGSRQIEEDSKQQQEEYDDR